MTCLEEPRKRACADEHCATALADDNPGTYCGPKCRRRASARRRRHEANPGRSIKVKPRFIRELRAEVPEGLCVYCECQLSGLQRFLCAASPCRNAYIDDWHLERDALRAADGVDDEVSVAAEARADFEAGRLRLAIQFDSARAAIRELRERIQALNFDNLIFEEGPKPHEGRAT